MSPDRRTPEPIYGGRVPPYPGAGRVHDGWVAGASRKVAALLSQVSPAFLALNQHDRPALRGLIVRSRRPWRSPCCRCAAGCCSSRRMAWRSRSAASGSTSPSPSGFRDRGRVRLDRLRALARPRRDRACAPVDVRRPVRGGSNASGLRSRQPVGPSRGRRGLRARQHDAAGLAKRFGEPMSRVLALIGMDWRMDGGTWEQARDRVARRCWGGRPRVCGGGPGCRSNAVPMTWGGAGCYSGRRRATAGGSLAR